MALSEQDGDSERRGLEHRVESSRVERTTDVGDIGQGVEIAENSVAIDENDISIRCIFCIETRKREFGGASPGFYGSEMQAGHLMWGDDESRIGNLVADPGPRWKQVLLIRRPGRSCNKRRPR